MLPSHALQYLLLSWQKRFCREHVHHGFDCPTAVRRPTTASRILLALDFHVILLNIHSLSERNGPVHITVEQRVTEATRNDHSSLKSTTFISSLARRTSGLEMTNPQPPRTPSAGSTFSTKPYELHCNIYDTVVSGTCYEVRPHNTRT